MALTDDLKESRYIRAVMARVGKSEWEALFRACAQITELEEENRTLRESQTATMHVLAEAITQLGGALTMTPIIRAERKQWEMSGPERLPDGSYRWRVTRKEQTP